MPAVAGLRQNWGRGASQGGGVGGWRCGGRGGDEVGCQECGSWSALLCVLCEMNRPMVGLGLESLAVPC